LRVAIRGYLLFVLAAGAVLPIQFKINAQLTSCPGSSTRAALAVDHFGWVGFAEHPVSALRLARVALLAAGVALVRFS
jgi:uncharacterized membrane protein YdcZ (DUF606 family)